MRSTRSCRKFLACAFMFAFLTGCGVARTTYKTTRFVRNTQQEITELTVKTTRAVGRATVKVVTWPIRAIMGGPGSSADTLATHGTDPTGPEPIIMGALPTETESAATAASSNPESDPGAARMIATDTDDPAILR